MATKMMVKRFKSPKVSLDLPMAGLASLAVAFVAYAMPDDMFSHAVGGSGLPSLVPAAAPPLGATARGAAIVAGAAGTFLLVWLLLRALGRPAKRPVPLDMSWQTPRLRRADAHPDAPPRRPLFAELDLGDPMDDVLDLEAEAWEEPHNPGEAVVDDEPLPAAAYVGEQVFPSPADEEQPSIASLMQRLESGLVRRQRHTQPPTPVPSFGGDPVDQRLRNALDNLQQMASRNG